jgi:ubiquinone/menaquinone biosynthesis C-methylase UbiE
VTDQPPLAAQRAAWERWNAETREQRLGEVSTDQRDYVVAWLQRLGHTDLDIIDVGCGAGWLCPSLVNFGRVTGTDFSADVLARAQVRMPEVRFVAGDFMSLPFEASSIDVVVSLEVLSHVADQPAFVAKLAQLLRPSGMLMLPTQNRPVLERLNRVPPPEPGAIRQWVDRDELNALLSPYFDVWELNAITPRANRFPLEACFQQQSGQSAEGVVRRGPKAFQGTSWLGLDVDDAGAQARPLG